MDIMENMQNIWEMAWFCTQSGCDRGLRGLPKASFCLICGRFSARRLEEAVNRGPNA